MPGVRASALYVLVVALGLLAIPPTSLAQPPPLDPARPAADRDTVVIGTSAEPVGLHPLFHVGGISGSIISALFTTDVEWNSFTDQPFAQGVEYLPSVRDGTWTVDGKKMTLRWKLKPRTWHDGRPVTCGDYVFTHRVMRDERVPEFASRREPVGRIANVVCPKGESGLEITVNWNERYTLANQAVLGQFWIWVALPRHLLEPFYRSHPARLDQTPFGHDPRATAGDGPYRWVEWRKGESLTMEAIPHHPIFGTPKIRRIVWRFIRDRDALMEQFLSGAIDVMSGTVVGLDQIVEMERRAAARIKVFFEPAPVWEHIDFNLDNPLLQDVRIRRGIAHGINRIQVVQQLFYGKFVISHTYLEPSNPGYTEELQKYPYDPARARRLLREAGLVPGADGILQHTSGRRLSLELSTTIEDPQRTRVAQVIQQQLRQVGIEITILSFPRRVFFGEVLTRRRFTLAMWAWIRSPDQGCLGFYTSEAIPAEPAWTGDNVSGYASADMDRVCKAASSEVDGSRRKQLLRESARIFARDLPAMPLYYRVAWAAAKVGLENFPGPGIPTTEMWNAATWYWR